jgi:hypothetical protein
MTVSLSIYLFFKPNLGYIKACSVFAFDHLRISRYRICDFWI